MQRSFLFVALLASALPVRGEAAPANLAAENQALVQRLDRAAAVAAVQRIADEREEVAAIADSPDSRKRDALQHYAEGYRAGGFDALVAIQKAKPHATAAGWREIAALAQDRKDRGEMGTAEVIPFFESALSLDPDDVSGWIELNRLYKTAGRLTEARHAAEQALAHARTDRERSSAETALGDAVLEAGDLPGARAHFAASLKRDEQLAEADPADARAQRDVSISLDRLGEVLFTLGDLAGARARFEASLRIRERLAQANPGSVKAQRDVSISLAHHENLGSVLATLNDLAGARPQFETSLKIFEQLAAANPSSGQAQRDLSLSLKKLGYLLATVNDPAGARARYEASLKIGKHVAATESGKP